MLCVMCVFNEFEPKEAPNLVSSPKWLKRVFDEFPYAMPEELLDKLPLRRRVDHVIKVMPKMAPLAKTPY